MRKRRRSRTIHINGHSLTGAIHGPALSPPAGSLLNDSPGACTLDMPMLPLPIGWYGEAGHTHTNLPRAVRKICNKKDGYT